MTDIFKKHTKDITIEQRDLILKIKTKAEELYDLYYTVDSMSCTYAKDREQIERAVCKLEESVMWAVKSISL
jgi:hypothetical protein